MSDEGLIIPPPEPKEQTLFDLLGDALSKAILAIRRNTNEDTDAIRDYPKTLQSLQSAPIQFIDTLADGTFDKIKKVLIDIDGNKSNLSAYDENMSIIINQIVDFQIKQMQIQHQQRQQLAHNLKQGVAGMR